MENIDISTVDKAKVLVALYNNSKPQGLGLLHYVPEKMSIDEARELLQEQTRFDYLKGRVLKVDLSENSFNPALYDRDNGQGAAYNALRDLFEE